MTEIRIDRARSRLAKAKRTAQGFVKCDARLTRTGVLEYTRADGTIQRELRPEDEVFRPASLESLALAPVTDMHPSEMVTPANVRALSIGVAGAPRRDGRFVSAELTVQAADAIARIDAGEREEISCGYTCDYDATPGVWEGQRYDGVQRNIVYNHVAIGPRNWGRAGSEVALRLDSGAAGAPALVSSDDDTDFAAAEIILTAYFDDQLELPAAREDLLDAGLSEYEADVMLGAHTDSADARLDWHPDQPRDERGRFTSGGSSSTGAKSASGSGDKRAKALNEIKSRLAKKAEAKAKRAAPKAPAKSEHYKRAYDRAKAQHERNGGFLDKQTHEKWGKDLDEKIAHTEKTLARAKEMPHTPAPIAQAQESLDRLHGERDAYKEHSKVRLTAQEKRAQTIAAKSAENAAPEPATKPAPAAKPAAAAKWTDKDIRAISSAQYGANAKGWVGTNGAEANAGFARVEKLLENPKARQQIIHNELRATHENYKDRAARSAEMVTEHIARGPKTAAPYHQHDYERRLVERQKGAAKDAAQAKFYEKLVAKVAAATELPAHDPDWHKPKAYSKRLKDSKFDGAAGVSDTTGDSPTSVRGKRMSITIKGVDLDLDATAEALITSALDEQSARIDELSQAAGARDAEIAALKARADAAEQRVAKIDRTELEQNARVALGAEVKLDGKSDAEIKAAVVAKMLPAMRLDSADAAYLQGAYVAACALAQKAHADMRAAAEQSAGKRTDASDAADKPSSDPAKARDEMIAKARARATLTV